MSRFYFGDSEESDNDLNIDDNLPFPKPISRASFLTPDFDPATYLSSLSNRHQTLGDLQTELRDLSESLNKELLDLVNENYQDFLSLGTALKGGEDKIEEVRAGLLGFQRDVRVLKEQFETRSRDVSNLLDEKKKFRSDIAIGYELLDVADRIELLEANLMIRQHEGRENGEDNDGTLDEDDDNLSDILLEIGTDSSDEEEEDETEVGTATGEAGNESLISLRRLESHIQKYLSLNTITSRIGEQHPFIASQNSRIQTIKAALLLDLSTALKQAESAGAKRDGRILTVLRLYELMGDQTEAILALKKLKI